MKEFIDYSKRIFLGTLTMFYIGVLIFGTITICCLPIYYIVKFFME